MAMTARQVESAVRKSPEALVKWQVIQDNIGLLPQDSLRDLIVDMVRILSTGEGVVVTDAVIEVIDEWHHRALSAAAQKESRESPVLTEEQWEALPDRWFDSRPKLRSR
jgi:hypothetical protein